MSQAASRRIQNPFATGRGRGVVVTGVSGSGSGGGGGNTTKRVNYNDFRYQQHHHRQSRRPSLLCSPVGIVICVVILLLCLYSLVPSYQTYSYNLDGTLLATKEQPQDNNAPTAAAQLRVSVPVPASVPLPLPASLSIPNTNSHKDAAGVARSYYKHQKDSIIQEVDSADETTDAISAFRVDPMDSGDLDAMDMEPEHPSEDDPTHNTDDDKIDVAVESHDQGSPPELPPLELDGESNSKSTQTNPSLLTGPKNHLLPVETLKGDTPIQKDTLSWNLNSSPSSTTTTTGAARTDVNNKGLELIKVDTETNNTELISRSFEYQGDTSTEATLQNDTTSSLLVEEKRKNITTTTTEQVEKDDTDISTQPEITNITQSDTNVLIVNHTGILDNSTKEKMEIPHFNHTGDLVANVTLANTTMETNTTQETVLTPTNISHIPSIARARNDTTLFNESMMNMSDMNTSAILVPRQSHVALSLDVIESNVTASMKDPNKLMSTNTTENDLMINVNIGFNHSWTSGVGSMITGNTSQEESKERPSKTFDYSKQKTKDDKPRKRNNLTTGRRNNSPNSTLTSIETNETTTRQAKSKQTNVSAMMNITSSRALKSNETTILEF